uniref:PDZ domain-containing protein n=1 Tax=Mola mola TaxID=94237 RepID=A0A3Q4BCE3_MOLML
MRIQGQPEGARRRLDLNGVGELRGVEIIRGRAGYGFTISGQKPCLLSGILEGSPADLVGLKQGDHIMAINGTDVSTALHETVVQVIGSCKGPLRMVVHVEGRVMGNPILNDAKFGIGQKSGIFQKAVHLLILSPFLARCCDACWKLLFCPIVQNGSQNIWDKAAAMLHWSISCQS